MSAQVETEYVHYGVCADCATGTDVSSEEEAAAWVDRHNDENHS